MPKQTTIRYDVIVEDVPNRGTWNMAVDEALLEAAANEGRSTLRWYRWVEPTVSLGYFQTPDGNPPELAGLPFVKRLSGGGAILHHHELTYSVTIPAKHPLTHVPSALYGTIHGQIAKVLVNLGIPVRLRGETVERDSQSFLCFSRADANDLVVGDHKIVGSAQRRRRGAVLQHGSLLLKKSPLAPQILGLADLGYEIPEAPRLAVVLADSVASVLGQPISGHILTDRTKEVASELEGNRYQRIPG